MKINFTLRLVLLCLFMVFSSFLSAQITYIVNTTDDVVDGVCNEEHCSLREAINAVNHNIGPDTIHFNIDGSVPFVIQLLTPLPFLRDDGTVLDGTTQPENFPFAELIILDGYNFINNGIVVTGDAIEIYGLQIQRFRGTGITLTKPAVIGKPQKGNTIIDNGGAGIWGREVNNVIIQSNFIGTNIAFEEDLGNSVGISVYGQNILIGGNRKKKEGNFICSNNTGISGGTGVTVQGNNIGTDISGNKNLGNFVRGIQAAGVGQIIGGEECFSNTIAFNGGGIFFNCSSCTANLVTQNSIYCNEGEGISSWGLGYSPPKITNVLYTSISGTSQPLDRIEVFKNNSKCNNCQGKLYLGSTVANELGHWTLSTPFNEELLPSNQITATATIRDTSNNTSQFSECWSFGTYIVNTIDDVDDGTCDEVHCSLREAIGAANSDSVANHIQFNIGEETPVTIILDSLLPPLIENNITIDGSTQTGYEGGVTIDGSKMTQSDYCSGIQIAANRCSIFGLTITNFKRGITIKDGYSDIVLGAQNKGNIIHSLTLSTDGQYGIIFGNATNLIIQGNKIGTDKTGIPNIGGIQYGIYRHKDSNNIIQITIGGCNEGQGNMIIASKHAIDGSSEIRKRKI